MTKRQNRPDCRQNAVGQDPGDGRLGETITVAKEKSGDEKGNEIEVVILRTRRFGRAPWYGVMAVMRNIFT